MKGGRKKFYRDCSAKLCCFLGKAYLFLSPFYLSSTMCMNLSSSFRQMCSMSQQKKKLWCEFNELCGRFRGIMSFEKKHKKAVEKKLCKKKLKSLK